MSRNPRCTIWSKIPLSATTAFTIRHRTIRTTPCVSVCTRGVLTDVARLIRVGDTPFCEHRRTVSHSATLTPVTPEWIPGDDCLNDGELLGARSPKRRRSGGQSTESLTSRLSRRWPSISKRWRDPKPTTSVSNTTVRSAPASRTSSVRLPSMRQSLAAHFEPAHPATPPSTPVESQTGENELSRPRGLSRPQKPMKVMIPAPTEDPIDRQELASTPLLPPMMAEHLSRSMEELQMQSPLQSPKVAEPGVTSSLMGTPTMTPTQGGMPTPPLSSKPSVSSFQVARSALALHPSSEIPPMAISEETDEWAIKLGHANFHIQPEPYLPEDCDLQACKRLLDDWEAARMEYMRQAARISEHYGPTSQTYKFTEQKWAEIDSQWRSYHEKANAEAGASTDDTYYQPLAETQPLSKMPSLNDPQQPSKFLNIEEADIVGPMVKYAKIQRRPSRRPAFLKLFTDPASLLGGRSALGLRR